MSLFLKKSMVKYEHINKEKRKFMIRLKNIKIRENLTEEEVFQKAISKNKINPEEVSKWYIYKKSIDARKKDDIHYNYTIDIELKDNKKEKRYEQVEEYKFPTINVNRKSEYNPVIIGAGPAGLFAGLILVDNGIKPIILERGKQVEERIKDVEEFAQNRKFNASSNIQFGEGGAGTFSDGKLNTGNSSNMYSRKVLEEFVRFGAPAEILYTAKPHIGTDNLRKIVKNIREYIISKGGQVLFNEQVTDFEIEEGKIKAVKCSKRIETDTVILAIGHSARDTFKRLYDLGVEIQPKNFAVGTRIEHLQKDINYAQYGESTHLKLPTADYKLVYHAKNGRTCYTFCMCPGGQVMASNSEENSIVTNGMSNFARDGKNANSALLVNVTVEDYYEDSPLDGMYFQEDLEKKAFELGGKNYNAPVQRVEDFFKNKETVKFGNVKPTYMPGVTGANLNEILPQFVLETMKEAIVELDKKLHGFADNDAILTGVETRSSSPVQITRNKETLNSVNVKGLYPCGEGAGYAGGIMTATIDGIKCAIKVLEK